ncbi:MAG: DUF2520 domain-containing protein [Chitinophagaceae bacterium]|nr:DUF2520 domain-containing protein [Chitinophagaceae bacterium]
MKIVLLGSGNLSTFYGHRFQAAGHDIVQVLSPDVEHAQALAKQLGCEAASNYAALNLDADMYVLGVRDDVLYTLAQTLQLPNKLVIYGAGAVPLNALSNISERLICLWCLFSIQKNNLPTQRHFPVVYNVSNSNDLALAKSLAHLLSDATYALNDAQKTKTHACAVLVNNFTNHLYTMAHELMRESNIDFALLHPIILDTAQRATQFPPQQLQTGPALRNDLHTIHEHLELLSNHKNYQAVYDAMSASIQAMYQQESGN